MNKQVALQRLKQVAKYVPLADILAFAKVTAEARKDEAASRLELAKVQTIRDTALANIRLKHEVMRGAFELLFQERREVVQQHFKVIDQGLASNNQEIVVEALKGLGRVIATSPFADLKLLTEALEGDTKIVL